MLANIYMHTEMKSNIRTYFGLDRGVEGRGGTPAGVVGC